MKKITLLMFLCLINCFAINLRITNIIPDLNICIVDNQYVFQVDGDLSKIYKGIKIDLNMDYFYSLQYWNQNIEVTEKKLIGRTEVSGLNVESERHDHYIYETTIYNFVFTPIGIINKRAMDLKEFTFFLKNTPADQPLRSLISVFTDNGWFNGCPKDVIRENLSLADTGVLTTVHYLLELYRGYPADLTFEIYPIYDRNFPNYLAGVLSQCYKRKVFLYDTYNALALVEYQ
jgi:hypothetical protein